MLFTYILLCQKSPAGTVFHAACFFEPLFSCGFRRFKRRYILRLALAEQKRNNAETKRRRNKSHSKAEPRYKERSAPDKSAYRQFDKEISVFLKASAPDQRADEEADKYRRDGDRRGVHKQQRERYTYSDARDHENDGGNRQRDKHGEAYAEGLRIAAEGCAVILCIQLFPQRSEPEQCERGSGNTEPADILYL